MTSLKAKSTKVASKTTKVASKKTSKKFYYMNVEFEGNESVIKVGETRNVKLKFVDEDNFLATEKAKRAGNGMSQSQTILDRTAHGKLSKDDYGAHVYFYFPFREFETNAWLAEQIEAEAELLGDRILELNPISPVEK